IAHYDYWSNSIRKSILVDAKADYLLYGMAEYATLALAQCLQAKKSPNKLRGLCYLSTKVPESALVLPGFAEVRDRTGRQQKKFAAMFMEFYQNNDPVTATVLAQQQDNRYLIQNPPWPTLDTKELDAIYELDFEREVHPLDHARGEVRAMATIRCALTTHRGCYGECNFCAIAVHQGRTVSSRSRKSLIAEAKQLPLHPKFKGTISDLGGPTANMYGFECEKKLRRGACANKRCLFPASCPQLPIDHSPQIELLQEIRKLKGIRKVVVASGIRYDMVLADRKSGLRYLEEIVRHHVSGQLKIAPEHCVQSVLACMGKPGTKDLLRFRELFFTLTKKAGRKQFLTYYIIAAHPGCRLQDMRELKKFALRNLKVLPRQVQIFTPTPSTIATLMYWTGTNPLTGRSCFVERSFQGREQQKRALLAKKIRRHKVSRPNRR
ncbi:MAG TPA: YgiQ family radical SAM protein, partial [Desulfobulbaceae bacterium]|nr:YgiQ family radical SAM protein [Desulfobulbaceae bacterium]